MTIAPVWTNSEAVQREASVMAVQVGAIDPAVGAGIDRLRIAVGVNDIVIRHLFSIGLALHTTRTMVPDDARDRLDATILELDATIGELRSLIFDLEAGLPVEQGPSTLPL